MLISNPSSMKSLPSDKKWTCVEKWKNSKFFWQVDCCSDFSTNELIDNDMFGSKVGSSTANFKKSSSFPLWLEFVNCHISCWVYFLMTLLRLMNVRLNWTKIWKRIFCWSNPIILNYFHESQLYLDSICTQEESNWILILTFHPRVIQLWRNSPHLYIISLLF